MCVTSAKSCRLKIRPSLNHRRRFLAVSSSFQGDGANLLGEKFCYIKQVAIDRSKCKVSIMSHREEQKTLHEGEDIEGQIPAIWMPMLFYEMVHASLTQKCQSLECYQHAHQIVYLMPCVFRPYKHNYPQGEHNSEANKCHLHAHEVSH